VAVPGLLAWGHGRADGRWLRLRSRILTIATLPSGPHRAVAIAAIVASDPNRSLRNDAVQSRLAAVAGFALAAGGSQGRGPVGWRACIFCGCFPFFRVQTLLGIGLGSLPAVAITCWRPPCTWHQQPHSPTCRVYLFKLPARRLAARPRPRLAQRRGACQRERVLGAGLGRLEPLAAGFQPCGLGASSTVSLLWYGLERRSTPAADHHPEPDPCRINPCRRNPAKSIRSMWPHWADATP